MATVDAFVRARDVLLTNRENYAAACNEFEWPRLDRFNWALDYFDAHARGNDRIALWVVNEDGTDSRELRQKGRRPGFARSRASLTR